MEALRKDVEQNPGHFQHERVKKFGVGQSTICYALKRLGISNKTLLHSKVDALARLRFQLKLLRYEFVDKRPIAYPDESGFAIDAPKDRGYSQKGAKCYASKDCHAKGRCYWSHCQLQANQRMLIHCNINTDVSYPWLTQELLLNVPENSVIVLENAAFHKRSDALLAVQQQGHTLELLPPYSPDLNPIEKK